MDDLKIIIDSLGEQNEEIDDNDLDDIEEEIDSIDKEEYFELAKISIKLGKPQILDYLVRTFTFNNNEINILYNEIKKYQQIQQIQIVDSDDEEDINEILDEYTKIIKNCRKLPYRKSIKNGN
jgi:predicted component of viral defense system (DUF524 family)